MLLAAVQVDDQDPLDFLLSKAFYDTVPKQSVDILHCNMSPKDYNAKVTLLFGVKDVNTEIQNMFMATYKCQI